MSYKSYTGMLKMHETFCATPSPFSCDFTAAELAILREQYSLAAIAGEGDALTRALRVMAWLSDPLM